MRRHSISASGEEDDVAGSRSVPRGAFYGWYAAETCGSGKRTDDLSRLSGGALNWLFPPGTTRNLATSACAMLVTWPMIGFASTSAIGKPKENESGFAITLLLQEAAFYHQSRGRLRARID